LAQSADQTWAGDPAVLLVLTSWSRGFSPTKNQGRYTLSHRSWCIKNGRQQHAPTCDNSKKLKLVTCLGLSLCLTQEAVGRMWCPHRKKQDCTCCFTELWFGFPKAYYRQEVDVTHSFHNLTDKSVKTPGYCFCNAMHNWVPFLKKSFFP
jgi:hypothetical protein